MKTANKKKLEIKEITLNNGLIVKAIDSSFHPDMHQHDLGCVFCGKKMNENQNTHFLHATHSGYFIPAWTELSSEEGSAGWFPIGSECAKKFPAEFVGEKIV